MVGSLFGSTIFFGDNLDSVKLPRVNSKMFSEVSVFIFKLHKEAFKRKATLYEKTYFSYDGLSVLATLIESCKEGPRRISSSTISHHVEDVSRRTVSNMIKSFCEWGFIHVDTRKWKQKPSGEYVRDSQLIKLDSRVQSYFGNSTAKEKRLIVENFISQIGKDNEIREK